MNVPMVYNKNLASKVFDLATGAMPYDNEGRNWFESNSRLKFFSSDSFTYL